MLGGDIGSSGKSSSHEHKDAIGTGDTASNAALCIAHPLLAKPVVCMKHPPLWDPGSPSHLFCACCAGLTHGTVWQEVA